MNRSLPIRRYEWVKTIGMPAAFGALLLALWQIQFFHALFRIKLHQLPLPSRIWTTIQENSSVLLYYTGYTMTEAVLGMLLGSAIGFSLACLATVWPRWGVGGVLLVAALNAVPIVSLAPIMNLWFGSGLGSRVAVVAITTIAAMAFNAHKGLNHIHPSSFDLMDSLAASKLQVFWRLRLPNSMPYIFTALKINTTAGMIGAIVSEFFFSSRGLGYMISNSITVGRMALGWSCIVLAALAGVLFFLVVSGIEKIFLSTSRGVRS